MKSIVLALCTIICITSSAQKNVVLRLNHYLNQSTFQYNQNFETDGIINKVPDFNTIYLDLNYFMMVDN